MAGRRLPGKKHGELFEGFEKIKEERIGGDKHEEFHGLLEKLSRIYSKWKGEHDAVQNQRKSFMGRPD
jgi:hypothetical protein